MLALYFLVCLFIFFLHLVVALPHGESPSTLHQRFISKEKPRKKKESETVVVSHKSQYLPIRIHCVLWLCERWWKLSVQPFPPWPPLLTSYFIFFLPSWFGLSIGSLLFTVFVFFESFPTENLSWYGKVKLQLLRPCRAPSVCTCYLFSSLLVWC